MKVTAVFDIGKTNKKFFLFDKNYKEVFKEYSRFNEIKDEDGDGCDDLASIENWITTIFRKIVLSEIFDVKSINFSTYGASFVHIDKNGQPVTPIYSYLKPFPKDLLANFYEKYGPEMSLAKQTASPPLQMLNSGLQLYYLKYAKPELFERIRWSLHLPQYISFLFTGIPLSEYTSIGCHTMLWDYDKNTYHRWVYEEGIDKIFPPIVETDTWVHKIYEGKKMKIGVGIHDSSAALLPYIRADIKPFLLISTGTWSISLNPFSQEKLTEDDFKNDCLNFLQSSGNTVKAARLFLGNEYKIQVKKLRLFYQKEEGYHRQMKFDKTIYSKLKKSFKNYFKWESITNKQTSPLKTSLENFSTYEEAFHQLMLELIQLQIESAGRAMGQTAVAKLYIDGGFADNEIFVKLLANHFQKLKIRTTRTPLGSALGAAITISEKIPDKNFLKKRYNLKKIKK